MEKFGNEGRMCMNMLWIRWKQSIENLKEDCGIGVVEVLLILVGILTTYYRVGIRCIE